MVLSVLISIECKQSKQENGMKKGAAKTIRTNKKQRLVNITFFFSSEGGICLHVDAMCVKGRNFDA